MDFVTHLPWKLWRHDVVWVIVDHEVGTFPSCADDLHIGGILPVLYLRDHLATWSTNIHSVR